LVSIKIDICGDSPFVYSILLIKGRQRKLVRAEIIISHLRPRMGKKKAPDKLLVTSARLLMLQRKAKEVASRPGTVFLAIKSMTIKKINIPIRLYITS